MSDGSCFKDALADAGITPDFDIPDWLYRDSIIEVCSKLGLRFLDGQRVSLDADKPVIYFYITLPGKGHALYCKDPNPALLAGKTLIGVIPLP